MKACDQNKNNRQAIVASRILRVLVFAFLFLGSICVAACGTLIVDVEEPTAMADTTRTSIYATESPETKTDASTTVTQDNHQRAPLEIVAWHGTVHTVPGSEPGHDYFKPWHLNIWPKYGPAVGITGADPSIDAEIDRIRDTDV